MVKKQNCLLCQNLEAFEAALRLSFLKLGFALIDIILSCKPAANQRYRNIKQQSKGVGGHIVYVGIRHPHLFHASC